MKSEICLIRHGITEGTKLGVYYGAVDIPLLDEGIEELTSLRDRGTYPQYENPEFYTSGMLRTEQTLETIYGQRPHRQIELLREYNFGEFEMRHHRDIKELDEYQAFVKDREGYVAPPGGECARDFVKRVAEGFNELKVSHYQHVLRIRNEEKMASSVAVIHGGVIAAIMDSCWPDEKDWFFKWTPDPGHGYILTLEDGGIQEYREF